MRLESLVIHELLKPCLPAKLITLDEFPHKKFPSLELRTSPNRSVLVRFFPSQKAFSLNDVEFSVIHSRSKGGEATQANMKHRTRLTLITNWIKIFLLKMGWGASPPPPPSSQIILFFITHRTTAEVNKTVDEWNFPTHRRMLLILRRKISSSNVFEWLAFFPASENFSLL